MQNYTIPFTKEALEQLPIDKINAAASILIQVFSPGYQSSVVGQALCQLESLFPRATVAGVTTREAIVNAHIEKEEITLSITTFEHTSLSQIHLKETTPTQSFQSGTYLAESLITKETKALLLFADPLSLHAQSMLEGIRSVNQEVIIAGGVAAYGKEGESALLISNSGISHQGIVAVALSGEQLHLANHYKGDWIPFGKKLLITHAKGNRIYSIDHMRATDALQHYLGEAFIEDFNNSKLLFPLVRDASGMQIARSILKRHDDGSIEVAGEVRTGELYQIGFGDLEEMILNKNLPLSEIAVNRTEVVFAFSCFARRVFMQDEISKEITPLCDFGNVSGFFTFGEFYSNGKEAYLLNHSMTLLSLSEKPRTAPLPAYDAPTERPRRFSTFGALAHLLTVNESEFNTFHGYLEEREKLLCKGPVVNFKIEMEDEARCSYISPNIKKLLGYSAKEFLCNEVTPRMLLDEETREDFLQEFSRYRENNALTFEKEIRVRAKYGDTKYLQIFAAIEKNSLDHRTALIGYCIDVTARVESQQKIQKLAFYDHVTGLPNRELLKSTLARKIEEAKADNKLCAVTFFDLDKFKDVNDTYGHAAGDRLLQLIANRIRAVLKKEDFIARIGGDEFILIQGGLGRNGIQASVYATINRILTIIHEPFNIDGKIAHVSTSIGTAIYGIDGESVEDLIKHADMAMYEAKKDPNVHFKFYSQTMRLQRESELGLQNALKEAVRKRAFTLLYQPQVDINSGKIVGAEALMRWNDPVLGEISPVTFIPMAEKMNLITELGEWLLEEVCHRIEYLQSHRSLPEHFRTIAVNISPIQFNDPYFVSKVKKLIDLMQIDTKYLEFELTEGVFAENLSEIVEKMHAIKAMGITLSLDDFGTGFSSLNYLKNLPVDTIKIDRSFISEVQKNEKDQVLTSTIIQLSQNMQCKIVAEGVENLEQLQFLEQNNCETYQGFYFSRPVTFEAFETLLFEETESEQIKTEQSEA